MNKLILVTFGGSPERAELCLYLNAAAGLYSNCDIYCYPVDKDTGSPNYLNTRQLYENYTDFRNVVEIDGLERTYILRSESIFDDMLKKSGINSPQEESIQYLMSKLETRSKQEQAQGQRLLDICLTQDDQLRNMEGGYYGKAHIGSVTGDILIHKEIYQSEKFYQEIQRELKVGNELDVVVVYSSFGGTGASLGINFGKFLHESLQQKQNLRLHCINIQPYFCFPEPNENDKNQTDYKQFKEKSAAVTAILAQENKLIRKGEQAGVFDRFYYIGQSALDQVSDENAPAGNQKNRIHIVDMLVSLAVWDILQQKDTPEEKDKDGLQLYAYQYEAKGTQKILWRHMPDEFKVKHIHMMRFCEFMLDCMETLFEEGFEGYRTHRLITHLYGRKGLLSGKADINRSDDEKLHQDIHKCIVLCRKYVQYWIQLEENTRGGSTDESVTSFFNLAELKRIAEVKSKEEFAERIKTKNNYTLCEINGKLIDGMEGIKKYTCLQIYEMLCASDALDKIARTEKNVAGVLVKQIYEMSGIDYTGNYRN